MNKIKEKIVSRFKGMTFKSYLKETIDFVNKNMKKTFLVLMLVSVIIVIIGLQGVVDVAKSDEYKINDLAIGAFGKDYIQSIQTIFVIILAGIVPYIYVPVVGSVMGAFSERTTLAYLIVKDGYFKAIIMYILPILLNICIICMATALGIYICKTVTLGYRLSNMNHMNFTNFKLQIYEITNKQEKKKALEKEKNKKLEELEKKNKKLDYLQITNVTILLFILQIIASLLKVIVI